MSKLTYVAPELRTHGALEVLTEANLGGRPTDAVFPGARFLSCQSTIFRDRRVCNRDAPDLS